MNLIPQTAPISELRRRQDEVLARAEKEPVILMSRSTPAGVLISPAQWDAIVKRINLLEQRERTRVADKQFADIKAGDYVEMTKADFEAFVREVEDETAPQP